MTQFTVTHPDPRFRGDMLGVTFADGAAEVDTAAEGGYAAYSYFQRAGYALAPVEPEADEPETGDPGTGDEEFDPATHTVAEVVAYLAGADEDEKARVLAAEKAGLARKGVIGDAEPTTDQGAQASAEQNGDAK